MNVEDMTAEELRALADEKAGAELPPASASVQEVDIGGMHITVYPEKMKTWHAFKIMSQVGDTLDYTSIERMFEFIEYVTDTTQDAIIEHCGGDDALLEDIVLVASRIINECAPKN